MEIVYLFGCVAGGVFFGVIASGKVHDVSAQINSNVKECKIRKIFHQKLHTVYITGNKTQDWSIL